MIHVERGGRDSRTPDHLFGEAPAKGSAPGVAPRVEMARIYDGGRVARSTFHLHHAPACVPSPPPPRLPT